MYLRAMGLVYVAEEVDLRAQILQALSEKFTAYVHLGEGTVENALRRSMGKSVSAISPRPVLEKRKKTVQYVGLGVLGYNI